MSNKSLSNILDNFLISDADFLRHELKRFNQQQEIKHLDSHNQSFIDNLNQQLKHNWKFYYSPINNENSPFFCVSVSNDNSTEMVFVFNQKNYNYKPLTIETIIKTINTNIDYFMDEESYNNLTGQLHCLSIRNKYTELNKQLLNTNNTKQQLKI